MNYYRGNTSHTGGKRLVIDPQTFSGKQRLSDITEIGLIRSIEYQLASIKAINLHKLFDLQNIYFGCNHHYLLRDLFNIHLIFSKCINSCQEDVAKITFVSKCSYNLASSSGFNIAIVKNETECCQAQRETARQERLCAKNMPLFVSKVLAHCIVDIMLPMF